MPAIIIKVKFSPSTIHANTGARAVFVELIAEALATSVRATALVRQIIALAPTKPAKRNHFVDSKGSLRKSKS